MSWLSVAARISQQGRSGPRKPILLRTALTPTINTIAETGLVSLPRMLTGQTLAGIDPVDAVNYQFLVKFLIVGATGIGATVVVSCVLLRLTDTRHRLRLDRISA